MRIYLDTCCLNRPFDDASVDRNRLEAQAVRTILRRVHSGFWSLIGSEAIDSELDEMPDADKRKLTRNFLMLQSESVPVGDRECARMRELVGLGFSAYDALHIACAETAKCDIFLTTDDDILKHAARHPGRLRVPVANPLRWIGEELLDED